MTIRSWIWIPIWLLFRFLACIPFFSDTRWQDFLCSMSQTLSTRLRMGRISLGKLPSHWDFWCYSLTTLSGSCRCIFVLSSHDIVFSPIPPYCSLQDSTPTDWWIDWLMLFSTFFSICKKKFPPLPLDDDWSHGNGTHTREPFDHL